jgi:hypothetical protein
MGTDQSFLGFFLEGINHITDPGGIDHMVFLLALVAGFELRHTLRVILLATAFTLGHSLTLALAAFKIVPFNPSFIEFLIPGTILLTALHSVRYFDKTGRVSPMKYIMAGTFGLIHGFGFSSYMRMVVVDSDSIVRPLLAFNLGIEAGQIAILLVALIAFQVLEMYFRWRTEKRNLFISGMAAGMAVLFLMEKWPF